MAKGSFNVLPRILTSFILLAVATLASAQPGPSPVCTPLPAGCSSGSCVISTEWIRDNVNCPETGHDPIIISKDKTLYITGGIKFRVDSFKQYGTKTVGGIIQCDWDDYEGTTAQPFNDVTKDVTGVAVGLNTYSQVHVLKAKDACTGCYEVNFPVKGGSAIDPHIQAGGTGLIESAKDACKTKGR